LFLPLQNSSDGRSIIDHHHPFNTEALSTSFKCGMGRATIIVVCHILLAPKLGFGNEGEALTANIFEGRPGFEGENIGLAVLFSRTKSASLETN
jgi:hypothetical protein